MTHKVKRISVNVVRGTGEGGIDILPHKNVVGIHSVRQGTNNFTSRDYQVIANTIDWSPIGSEPIIGTEYTVNYDFFEE